MKSLIQGIKLNNNKGKNLKKNLLVKLSIIASLGYVSLSKMKKKEKTLERDTYITDLRSYR